MEPHYETSWHGSTWREREAAAQREAVQAAMKGITPKAAARELVLTALRFSGEPLAILDLKQRTKLTSDQIQRALDSLRADGLVIAMGTRLLSDYQRVRLYILKRQAR